jgi:hypothetical protein
MWSRGFLDKLMDVKQTKKFPHSLWDLKVQYPNHNSTTINTILSEMHPIYNYLVMIHFNAVLPSTTWSPK